MRLGLPSPPAGRAAGREWGDGERGSPPAHLLCVFLGWPFTFPSIPDAGADKDVSDLGAPAGTLSLDGARLALAGGGRVPLGF